MHEIKDLPNMFYQKKIFDLELLSMYGFPIANFCSRTQMQICFDILLLLYPGHSTDPHVITKVFEFPW